MLEFKAFVSVTTYADNSAKAVAPVGELSKIGRSFSRDIKVFPNPTKPEVIINLFAAHEEDSDEYFDPTGALLDEMHTISEWVITQGDLGLASTDLPSYIDSINGNFVAMDGQFQVGNLVQYNGSYYPSSVTFVAANGTYNWKLWFADAEFQGQYDEYHVETVFPVDDIDDLHLPYIQTQLLLEKATSTSMLSKIMEIEKEYPSTVNKGEDYTWHDKSDAAVTLPISFAVVIYGKAGDNVDVIRETIVRDILAVSRYDRSAWAKILPELFSPNEMIFVPYWEAIMESYDPLADDIYRSAVEPMEIVDLAVKYTPNFSPEHIMSRVNLVPTLWRGIVMAATPHEPLDDNPSPMFREMYPDYLLAATTDMDFHRMSEGTRDLVGVLFALLTYAESLNDYTQLPAAYSRTLRNGHEFVTISLNGYLYHVLTKRSYMELQQVIQA